MVHSSAAPIAHAEHALTSTDQHWLFRYKLYHIPFWMLYQYLWWCLRLGSPIEVAAAIFSSPQAFCKYIFYVAFQIAGIWFNLYFLMPRLLDRGRYAMYVLAVLVTIVLCAWFIVGGYYVGAMLSEKSFQELYGRSPTDVYGLFEGGSLPSTAAAMTLAMSIKLTKRWIEGRKRVQLLEQEKLETELKFLKSQFNPHFLFNTINSIFVLINKDPRRASDALARFSDLLRYQLYECNEPEITLSQELNYLENFVSLQKLRQEDNLELTFTTIPALAENFMIAPFMLIPFAENAFKHVSRHKQQRNFISLTLSLNQDTLRFEVVNSTASGESRDLSNVGGIGLQNVTRRLALLYPDAHQLLVVDRDHQYRVVLELHLRRDTTPVRSPMSAAHTEHS